MRTLIASLVASLNKDRPTSAELVRRALAQPARDPEVKFYLARHLARDATPSEALQVIQGLIQEGFFCSTSLQRDPWLQPLSRQPEFQDVIDAIVQREAGARAAFVDANGERILS
jgi:hypothetical protein